MASAKLEQFAGGDFSEYLERLEFYFTAHDIGVPASEAQAAQADRKKFAHLISSLSKEVYSTLRSLCLPNSPADKTFQQVCDLLKGYYKVQTSTTTASFAFRNCVQKPAERLIDFSNRLKRAAVPCEFGEHLDRALKDQFVASLCDQDIKRKILTTPDEDTQTFNNVFKLAEREERAILHSRQLSTSPSTATSSATSTCSTSVNKIRHDYHGNKPKSAAAHAGGAVPKPQRSTAATPSSSSRRRRQCYRCSSDLHLANKCPHRGSKCSYCHKIGHLEHACLSKKRASGQSRIHHLDAEVDSGEVFPELPDVSIYTIKSNPNNPPYSIKATINDSPIPISLEIDTGSGVTLINRSDFEKLGMPLTSLSKPTIRLRGFSGNQIACLGEVQIPVTINGQTHSVLLRVVDTVGPSLLGRDVLSLFQLNWKEIFSIKTEIDEALAQAEYRAEIQSKYPKLFDTSSVGKLTATKVTLRVSNDRPVYTKARTMPFSVKEHVDAALDKLEADGIIEKVASSPWASPTVPVRKPNGSIRVCADYSKTINANSDLERYPLPTIEEIRTKLRGGKKFSTLDLSQAYHQLELDDASKVYTTINTHRGLYQYTRLPFGIHSAVSIFQRTMENLLGDIEGCVVYVDDIIITGKNDEEHKKCLEKVLKRLEDAGMRVNPEKIQLMQEKISSLGHVFNANGVAPSPDKIRAMVESSPPSSVSELQSFIGSVNYVRKFIPNLASLLSPLYRLLKKNVPWQWTKTEDDAFRKLKDALCSTEVLAYYSPDQPLVLQTDASGVGLGAVLLQRNGNGDLLPVAYASRTPLLRQNAITQTSNVNLSHWFLVLQSSDSTYWVDLSLWKLITIHWSNCLACEKEYRAWCLRV